MTSMPRMAAAAALLCFAPGAPGAAQAPDRPSGAARVETRSVEINGLPMRVQTAGWHHRERGQPIVVLENGAGAPVEAWQPVFAALAEFAAVVAYDRTASVSHPDFYRALAPLIAQLPPGNQAELRVIEELVTADGGDLATLAQPTVPTARLVAGRHDPMPPGLDMPFDERAFWHGVLRHSIGRFAASLPEGPHASLIVAAHARHYIMGDDPGLVIDAIRRVSAAAAAAPPELRH